ncbi:hypothetical protein B0H14DRAFT_3722202 [Mycena olivaceomarginata]|nr:hypothetical protein B0H14DRAFT_3722202 [Mycena olivaceomarginata]
MPNKDEANWVADPQDITNLLLFFQEQRSRVGEGGNWDKTVLNEAAVYMANLGPPVKGGPKTASSIATILQMKQKAYPGASGWTYSDELGFNVTDDNLDAWANFSRAHPIFKPFATCGWAHFKIADEIIPSRARGRFVFSVGSLRPADLGLSSQSQSQDDDDESSQPSQPLTDSWSQSNYG